MQTCVSALYYLLDEEQIMTSENMLQFVFIVTSHQVLQEKEVLVLTEGCGFL